jgi:hypothetical protein
MATRRPPASPSREPRGPGRSSTRGVPVEREPEVTAWLDGLADNEFGRVERYIDLLADQGALLGEPFTRQLDG